MLGGKIKEWKEVEWIWEVRSRMNIIKTHCKKIIKDPMRKKDYCDLSFIYVIFPLNAQSSILPRSLFTLLLL